jgi:hypothetical protein
MLDATGPGGGSRATDRVRVVAGAPTATPAPTGVPEPAIDSFSVEPGQLNAGGCVKIAWSTSAGTSSTRILRDGAVMQDEAGLSGRLSDCLSDPGTYAYRLEAYNRAGAMVSSDTSVTVVGGTEPTAAPPTEAPEPTAVPDAVEVTSFSSAPGQIDASNACVTLTWTIEGSGLALVRLFRNGELVASDPESGYQDCPDASLAGTTIAYTLQADSEHGSGDSAELSVDYVAPAPLPGDANP